MHALPITWIRAEKYSEISGEPMNTIYERIREGIWAAGKHYKRTGQRTLWINLSAADEWIENSPHVEVSVPVKALKSGKARAGSGFA